jgi:type I restriction enzyme S subunit
MLSITFLSQLSMTDDRVKMPKINQEELAGIQILFPDEVEQKKIVAILETALDKMDSSINATAKEIGLIQEFCERLISDAVTGRVDVREVKVPKYEVKSDLPSDEEGYIIENKASEEVS